MKWHAYRRACLAAAVAWTAWLLCSSQTLVAGFAISFADPEAGGKLLSTRDDFIRALSPFDRAARMKTNREVGESEFLEFLGKNARPWQESETRRIREIVGSTQARFSKWNLPFPESIVFVKTSGREEGQAEYTRGNAVMIPADKVNSGTLERTITHELFHVLSRSNPDLRTNLYGIIGFKPAEPIDLPQEWRARKITNPDGVDLGWAITVTNWRRTFPVAPILYASAEQYDPARGGEFFDYLVFELMVVTNQAGRWGPRLVDGHPETVLPGQAQGFFEQVGRNTTYILHPDEILADNFVYWVYGETNVPTPRILTEMEQVFRQANRGTR